MTMAPLRRPRRLKATAPGNRRDWRRPMRERRGTRSFRRREDGCWSTSCRPRPAPID